MRCGGRCRHLPVTASVVGTAAGESAADPARGRAGCRAAPAADGGHRRRHPRRGRSTAAPTTGRRASTVAARGWTCADTEHDRAAGGCSSIRGPVTGSRSRTCAGATDLPRGLGSGATVSNGSLGGPGQRDALQDRRRQQTPPGTSVEPRRRRGQRRQLERRRMPIGARTPTASPSPRRRCTDSARLIRGLRHARRVGRRTPMAAPATRTWLHPAQRDQRHSIGRAAWRRTRPAIARRARRRRRSATASARRRRRAPRPRRPRGA